MHGHAVGNLLGFRSHGDPWSFGSFAVAAIAACHCKNKSRDCHTHYRMTYPHRFLLAGADPVRTPLLHLANSAGCVFR